MKYTGWWIIFLILVANTNQSLAQGDLMIYPRRLVLGSNQRSIDVTLANSGTDSSTYILSWKNYKMTELGKVTEIIEPDSGQFFADEHLRFFPREVRLAPGESQKVKVQRISNRELDEGEYRSHLEFRSAKPMGASSPTSSDRQEGIRTQLNMHLAITIPVIMEIGDIIGSATLQNATLSAPQNSGLQFQFDIIRQGKKSTYGDFKLTYESPEGKEIQVGLVRGVAVYAPARKRSFSIPITTPEGLTLSNGELTLEYIAQTRRKEIIATLKHSLK